MDGLLLVVGTRHAFDGRRILRPNPKLGTFHGRWWILVLLAGIHTNDLGLKIQKEQAILGATIGSFQQRARNKPGSKYNLDWTTLSLKVWNGVLNTQLKIHRTKVCGTDSAYLIVQYRHWKTWAMAWYIFYPQQVTNCCAAIHTWPHLSSHACIVTFTKVSISVQLTSWPTYNRHGTPSRQTSRGEILAPTYLPYLSGRLRDNNHSATITESLWSATVAQSKHL